MGEDHNREGAQAVVLAEIKIVSFASCLHADDFAGDAVSFSNVLGCLVEGYTVGAEGGGGEEESEGAEPLHKENCRSAEEGLMGEVQKKRECFPKEELVVLHARSLGPLEKTRAFGMTQS